MPADMAAACPILFNLAWVESNLNLKTIFACEDSDGVFLQWEKKAIRAVPRASAVSFGFIWDNDFN